MARSFKTTTSARPSENESPGCTAAREFCWSGPCLVIFSVDLIVSQLATRASCPNFLLFSSHAWHRGIISSHPRQLQLLTLFVWNFYLFRKFLPSSLSSVACAWSALQNLMATADGHEQSLEACGGRHKRINMGLDLEPLEVRWERTSEWY